MVSKKELLRELKEKFDDAKKELNFNPTYEELEQEFRIEDAILSSEFVSNAFSRQLCARILDNFMGWHNYLNGLISPTQGYLASQTEANLFNNNEDRELIWDLIKKSMTFSSEHSLIGLTNDKEREAKFIDETFNYWKETFSPGLIKILSKVHEGWNK